MTARPLKQPEGPIPAGWRDAVRAVLHARHSRSILPTQRAQEEWLMTFPTSWLGELYDVLEKTLGDGALCGRAIPDIRPPGEAYEFLFTFQDRKMYAKLNLYLPERKVVAVVSAHPRYKGDTL